MRILMLNYEYPPLGGGAAPVSKEHAERLASRGHNIDVVTMGFKDLPDFEKRNGVNIYRVDCLRTQKSSCQPWEQFTYIVAAKAVIRNLMQNRKYDICHAQFIVPTGELARWVKKKYGLKYIISSHGSDVEGYNTKISNRTLHRFIRGGWRKIVSESEMVVANSKYLLNLIKKRYHGKNCTTIPYGIEMSRFEPAGDMRREKSILYIGRLQITKNVQSLMKALSKVHNLSGWRVDIVGDGPYRKTLEQLTASLGLENNINFHGWIDNGSKEHINFLHTASLFVSESYFESFGVAVMEAVVSGCDILLSDIWAHRMLVQEKEVFTNPDDVDEIAKKIEQYIDDPETLKVDRFQMRKFEWNKVIDSYEELYRKVLQN